MTHHFETEQLLAAPIDRVFLFFANPANLPRIMPGSIGAQLVRVHLVPPPEVRAPAPAVTEQASLAGIGSEIVVSIRLIPFLPFRMEWIAKITEFEWNHHFADEQRKGPLKSFHHRHELRAERAGTIVHDMVDYDIGFGWAGDLANFFFAGPLLRRMFRQRQEATERLLSRSS